MPHISLRIDDRLGALLDVLVGSPGLPSANQRRRIALLDTGAEHSAIDQQLAHEMELQVVDTTELVTPAADNGSARMVYTASLCIEAPGMISEAPEVRLTGADLSQQGFSVLLGRDILKRLVIIWDGPAQSARLCI